MTLAVAGATILLSTIVLAAVAVDAARPDRPDRRPELAFPPEWTARASPSVTSSGPEFTTVTDICGLLPAGVARRLLPGTAAPRPETSGRRWSCTRVAERRRGGETGQRSLTLRVELYEGAQDAADALARDRAAATPGAAGRAFETGGGPLTALPGVGDEAFSRYAVSKVIGAAGRGAVHVRLRNAVVEVGYGGHDRPVGEFGLPDYEAQRPLPEAPARRGAEEAARAVVRALTGCAPCTG
ncbi:hypothetical protein DPM19_09020 [Actinomadura craniellae]|uniref:DUF3558 domain-containing protein n=1 Tax=Actinomadura craniellae TaxID=2231787 RepID=A0A365HA57_9ACTN|nr:hypothetical protein DPM19_09020 [Actinomadura craniellae]